MLSHPAGVSQTAAQQLVERDDVLGADHVGVGIDQHDRHRQLLHARRPVVVLAHVLAHVVEQPREILRARCDGDVRFVHRRLFHGVSHRRAHRGLLRQHLGEKPAARVQRGDEDEATHQLRVLKRELQRGRAAERVAHDVDLAQTELLDDDGKVAADVDRVDLPVAECSTAVTM